MSTLTKQTHTPGALTTTEKIAKLRATDFSPFRLQDGTALYDLIPWEALEAATEALEAATGMLEALEKIRTLSAYMISPGNGVGTLMKIGDLAQAAIRKVAGEQP